MTLPRRWTSCRPAARPWACRCRRAFRYSEPDYSVREARLILGRSPRESRAGSIRRPRWRCVYRLGLPEQRCHLQADPQPMHDLVRDPSTAAVGDPLCRQLADSPARRKHRTTVRDPGVAPRNHPHRDWGMHFGRW